MNNSSANVGGRVVTGPTSARSGFQQSPGPTYQQQDTGKTGIAGFVEDVFDYVNRNLDRSGAMDQASQLILDRHHMLAQEAIVRGPALVNTVIDVATAYLNSGELDREMGEMFINMMRSAETKEALEWLAAFGISQVEISSVALAEFVGDVIVPMVNNGVAAPITNTRQFVDPMLDALGMSPSRYAYQKPVVSTASQDTNLAQRRGTAQIDPKVATRNTAVHGGGGSYNPNAGNIVCRISTKTGRKLVHCEKPVGREVSRFHL